MEQAQRSSADSMLAFFDRYNLPESPDIPFGETLFRLFFSPDPRENLDFPIHGPNVLRFVAGMLELDLKHVVGLLSGDTEDREQAASLYARKKEGIFKALDCASRSEQHQVFELLKVGALYHDIGKVIRRPNHPQIGTNLLRHSDTDQSRKLVTALGGGNPETGRNRFSLICSITRHHDKFGVVSTGEGGLPIFSDIPYFTSDKSSLSGIQKNVTSVMVLNLADIAAVAVDASRERSVLKKGLELAHQIGEYRRSDNRADDTSNELQKLGSNPAHCLGLRHRKIDDILSDWQLLLELCAEAHGDRRRLRDALIVKESNPSRTITRLRRLLIESAETTKCERLTNFFDKTTVENTLVGILGANQLEFFSERFALVAKMDYALRFFQSLVRASVRQSLIENKSAGSDEFRILDDLKPEEIGALNFLEDPAIEEVALRIITLFVKVIQKIVSRYTGVLTPQSTMCRRFGFQLRELTDDRNIWTKIVSLLCHERNVEDVGLTWIADEVSIWSMD